MSFIGDSPMDSQANIFQGVDVNNFELKFDKPIPQYTSRLKLVNPMISKYGPGPKDTRCKGCKFIFARQGGGSVFFKCQFRGDTRGPGTDHRANWETCSKFET